MSGPSDDLVVGSYTIPADELVESFATSGGPGGQHANRSNTRVELRFDLGGSSAFPQDLAGRMIEKLGSGVVAVSVDDSRSQWRNRSLARRRLVERLESAMQVQRTRRPTTPTRASRRRRANAKRRRSETKRLRRRPEPE